MSGVTIWARGLVIEVVDFVETSERMMRSHMSKCNIFGKTASFILFCAAIGFSSSAHAEPEICYNDRFSKSVMDRLVVLARAEAQKKHVDRSAYNGIIAVDYWSRKVLEDWHRTMQKQRDTNREASSKMPPADIIGVRFTPFACNDMGTDGGGFDVDINPKTFEVLDSRNSLI